MATSARLALACTVQGGTQGGANVGFTMGLGCFILLSSFPLLLVFVVGGLGFEFRVFVAG